MTDAAFPESPLVAALVDDLAAPPRLLYHEGFVGCSSRRNYVRVFSDEVLNEFYDFPQESVRHVIALPTSASRPFGGNAVWVDIAALEKAQERPVYYRQGERQTPLTLEELTESLGSTNRAAPRVDGSDVGRRSNGGRDGTGGNVVPPDNAINDPNRRHG